MVNPFNPEPTATACRSLQNRAIQKQSKNENTSAVAVGSGLNEYDIFYRGRMLRSVGQRLQGTLDGEVTICAGPNTEAGVR